MKNEPNETIINPEDEIPESMLDEMTDGKGEDEDE